MSNNSGIFSLYPPAADDEMLSFYEKELLESDQFKHQVEQMGENKWILRFKEVKGSLKK